MNILKIKSNGILSADKIQTNSSILEVKWLNLQLIFEENNRKFLGKFMIIYKEISEFENVIEREIHAIYSHGLSIKDSQYKVQHTNTPIIEEYLKKNINSIIEMIEKEENTKQEKELPEVAVEIDQKEEVTKLPKTKKELENEKIKTSKKETKKIKSKEITEVFDEEISFNSIIISKFLYNNTTKDLKVVFQTGKEQIFKNVEKQLIDDAKVTENINLFFNRYIRVLR